MFTRIFLLMAGMLLSATVGMAQPSFSMPHGLYDESITVSITPLNAGADVYYTTDGSTPTMESTHYTGPLTLTKTTLHHYCQLYHGVIGVEPAE